ncbi:glycosyltransferase [Solwaraspora sp. WMMD406]|uniref:glycosyltransferase n=1 Tax=Solwaraspora sp. WMMD406 TaxID=3016095 RepID=UPI00241642E8|nr:glycosyltransferase [Solwaraspora sp. WMMD406]MDG4763540.1 glycosyltransferase [Solwaraspora sp. WMMD406]
MSGASRPAVVDLAGRWRWRIRVDGRRAHAHEPLPGRGGPVRLVEVDADSVATLRRLLAEPAAVTPARRLRLRVRRWSPPAPGWSGRLGPLPQLRRHRIRLPGRGGVLPVGASRAGVARVEVEVGRAVPLYDLLGAALAVLAPVRPLPRPASADVTGLGAAPAWLPPAANHTVGAGPLVANPEIRAYDVVLAADAAALPAPADLVGVAVTAGDTGARVTNRQPIVLIDSAVANPIGRGRRYGPQEPIAWLDFPPGEPVPRWRLRTGAEPDGPTVVSGRLDQVPLDGARLAAVRGFGNVWCGEVPASDPAATATLLAQLAATGVVLRVPTLPPAVADRLAEPLLRVLASEPPAVTADGLEWEIRSVRQRSAALRGHAAAFASGAVTVGTLPALAAPPSVSAVLVTRRPEYLPDVVGHLARQTYPELEIVLCLHGIELAADLRSRLVDCGRPIQVFTAPAGLSFGEVMGAATARARGSLITKVDDDDVYGPEHVWDLVLAREYSGATLVGKAAEFVVLQTLGVTVRRAAVPPEAYGAPVAGGTMLLARGDLEAVGGWRPVPRSVDRGLMDRVLRSGGLIYRTHPLGYLYERRSSGHTWDAGLDYFLRRAGQQWDRVPRHREFGTEVTVG